MLMNLYHLIWKKESLPAVLLGAALVFGVLILFKITDFIEASARAQNIVEMAIVQNKPSAERTRAAAMASESIAEELKKYNLFSPPPPPRNPVASVLGILGDEALIGDRWYKAGDMIGNAEIVAIEPTQVRVQWQGRETVFVPMEIAEEPQARDVNSPRRNPNKAEQNQALASEDRGQVSGQRAERSHTAKSEKVFESDKTKAEAKQKSLSEKKQYEKLLKQNVKDPKKETATADKANSNAIARKKAVASQVKKQERKSSR